MKRILLPLCILMAVLIIIVSMTTISFSWFEPGSLSGSGLSFSTSTFVSSTDCSAKTYYDSNSDDGVNKYDVEINNNDEKSYEVELSAGQTRYFKTVINNRSEKYAANVSLYLSNFQVSNGGKASLAVIVPTNTYRTYTVTQTDLHIIRNAYITEKVTGKLGYGELEVEWFVTCESGTVTFDLNSVGLYLMYD